MTLTAGVDVGSSAVKVSFVASEGGEARLLSSVVAKIRKRDVAHVAREAYDEARKEAGGGEPVYVASTGDGEDVPFATGHFYGMTTHARGALFLEPSARAVVDVGGLHARAISVDARGRVLGYRMTSQCASGSGQFLENIARYLGVPLGEIGPVSLAGKAPEAVSSICAVLAETDVINMVSRGASIPNILKGIHRSMAGRCVRLVVSTGVTDVLLVTGGLAADEGLLTALRESAAEQKVPLDVRSHPQSILAGAIGAALWGAFRAKKLAEKGLDLKERAA